MFSASKLMILLNLSHPTSQLSDPDQGGPNTRATTALFIFILSIHWEEPACDSLSIYCVPSVPNMGNMLFLQVTTSWKLIIASVCANDVQPVFPWLRKPEQ